MANNDSKPTHHRSASTPTGAGSGTQPLTIPAPSHPSTTNSSPNVSSPPTNRPRRSSILSMFGLSPPPAPLSINTSDPTSRLPGLSHSPSSSTDSAESYGLAQSAPAQPSVWPQQQQQQQQEGKQSVGPQSPLSSWLRQLHDHAEEDDAVGQGMGPGQGGMARLSRTTSRPDYGPVGMGPGARRLSFGWPASAAAPGEGITSPVGGVGAGVDDAGQFGLFRRMSLGSRAQPPISGAAPFVKDLPSTFDESVTAAGPPLDRGREAVSRRRNSAARRPSPMGERILRGEGGWPH